MVFNEIFDIKVVKKKEKKSFIDDIYNFLSILTYLTCWNLILIVFYLCGYLEEYYHTILLLQICIVIGSIYIVYIKKSFKYERHTDIIIPEKNLSLLDLLMHQLPLYILLLQRESNPNGVKLGLYLLPIYYYLLFGSKKYNLNNIELIGLVLIWLIIPFQFKIEK